MKKKKLKVLFKAIEDISKKDPKEIYGIKSNLKYKYESGRVSNPLMLLATSGKYCLPETKIIKKIISSIEPKDLRKEVININREAGFNVLTLSSNKDLDKSILVVNTAYGVIAFTIHLNEDESETMTEKEFRALNGWIKEVENS